MCCFEVNKLLKLHSKHYLCMTCLKKYMNYISGNVWNEQLDFNAKCPARGCDFSFCKSFIDYHFYQPGQFLNPEGSKEFILEDCYSAEDNTYP